MSSVEGLQLFNQRYITSSEICRILKIPRATLVSGKNSGKLPDPIEVPDINTTIWERPKVMPFIENWRNALNKRRRVEE